MNGSKTPTKHSAGMLESTGNNIGKAICSSFFYDISNIDMIAFKFSSDDINVEHQHEKPTGNPLMDNLRHSFKTYLRPMSHFSYFTAQFPVFYSERFKQIEVRALEGSELHS